MYLKQLPNMDCTRYSFCPVLPEWGRIFLHIESVIECRHTAHWPLATNLTGAHCTHTHIRKYAHHIRIYVHMHKCTNAHTHKLTYTDRYTKTYCAWPLASNLTVAYYTHIQEAQTYTHTHANTYDHWSPTLLENANKHIIYNLRVNIVCLYVSQNNHMFCLSMGYNGDLTFGGVDWGILQAESRCWGWKHI